LLTQAIFINNMKKVYYKEVQKFGSIPLYFVMGLIYISILGFFFYALINEFVYHGNAIKGHMTSDGLIISSVLTVVILMVASYLLFGSKLITEITAKSVNYRFPPFIKKNKIIDKESISSWEIRKYKPIKEYGGWGIRYSPKKKVLYGKKAAKHNSAVNVKGNIGLQLVFKNGKRLLIGTQRQEAIRRAMKKMYNSK